MNIINKILNRGIKNDTKCYAKCKIIVCYKILQIDTGVNAWFFFQLQEQGTNYSSQYNILLHFGLLAN